MTLAEQAAGPLVALVGRPNVGKSTLFNRLTSTRDALVENEPGVTRDRRYGVADWDGRQFRVVDTGGFDFDAFRSTERGVLARAIFDQAWKAIEEADLVLLIVDGKSGLVAEDMVAVERLRKSGKPTIYVANKIDRGADEANIADLHRLGPDVFGVSAEHGRSIADLLDAILARLPEAPEVAPVEEDDATRPIRLALVGRPNAGKSSLVNRMLGEDRMLVDSVAGTTRDAIDTAVTIAGRDYVLVDTAGIRRKAKVHAAAEKISVAMAEKSIRLADVCVLVIDAEEGIAEQDAKIAGLCDEYGRALVLCFNKLDLITAAAETKLRENVSRQLQFVPWAKVVSTSAKTGKGMQRLLDAVQHAYQAYTRRVTTGALNRWFETIVEKHPPSLFRGKPVKLYFIQQPQAKPPTFLLSVNHPEGVHFSYRRYLTNQLREEFELDGTPVRLICKARSR